QQIPAGRERTEWIKKQIDEARVILLLISKDYIGDDDYYEGQLLRAMERYKRGDASVIPILLRRYDVADEPFARLQELPRCAGKPGDRPIERDSQGDEEILTEVVKDVRRAVEVMRGEIEED